MPKRGDFWSGESCLLNVFQYSKSSKIPAALPHPKAPGADADVPNAFRAGYLRRALLSQHVHHAGCGPQIGYDQFLLLRLPILQLSHSAAEFVSAGFEGGEMAAKLTVLIPCKNERRNIRPCIESVAGDRRRNSDCRQRLDRRHAGDRPLPCGGCRIIEREYVNSADFKNWAIPQAQHDWVLVVDADERVTPQLADEIRQVLADPPPAISTAIGSAATTTISAIASATAVGTPTTCFGCFAATWAAIRSAGCTRRSNVPPAARGSFDTAVSALHHLEHRRLSAQA